MKRNSVILLNNIIATFKEHDLEAEDKKDLSSTENLSRGARRALQDFCNHLKVLKKPALDEEGK
jgi:hypothetical protein